MTPLIKQSARGLKNFKVHRMAKKPSGGRIRNNPAEKPAFSLKYDIPTVPELGGYGYSDWVRNAPYNAELRNVLNNKLGWNSDAGLLENTLNAAGSVIGPSRAAKNTGEVISKGERFKNWVKPLATATAVNFVAGGLPAYQTLLTLRKFLAGKGMRFADARIADLKKSIAGATGYKRRALRAQLQRYESLNGVHQSHYKKLSYPGIWAGALLSVPAAYIAHKGAEWIPWLALDKAQQDALTAQGEKPTTHNQDANKGLSRLASYWKGITRLPAYFEENDKHPLGKDIRDNIPYVVGDRADEKLRELKQRELIFQGVNEVDLGQQGASRPYDSNNHNAYKPQSNYGPNNYADSTPQIPTFTNGITYDPNSSSSYEHSPAASITMRR